MASTRTFRRSLIVGFLLVQFFWLFATFAYSETSRSDRDSRESGTLTESTSPASLSSITPEKPAEPRAPLVPSSPSSAANQPSDPSAPSAATDPSTPGTDLGSRIKYCIVFPILNAAGAPIPTFDVPQCEGASPPPPPPPPPPGSPRLTVVKVVINDDSGSATTTDFTLFVGSTTVQSGVKRTFLAGTYVISEATTTVTKGTTTMMYVADFSGDCNSAGSVTLALGDDKTCVLTNDDEGPGGQGGEGPGGNGGGPGGNGGGPGSSGGGPSSSSSGGSSGGSASSGSGSALYPGGQIAGVTPTPDYMGGYTPEPGPPNAGLGGRFADLLGMLLFSGMSALFTGFLSRVLNKQRTADYCQV